MTVLRGTLLWLLPAADLACSPYVEQAPASNSARLRTSPSELLRCEFSEDAYRRVVSEWLRASPADAGLTSLALGRITSYPWLSRRLAEAALIHAGWRGRGALASPAEQNRIVASILSSPDLLQRLAQPFEGSAYLLGRVSVEKVLVGRVQEVTSGAGSGNARVP